MRRKVINTIAGVLALSTALAPIAAQAAPDNRNAPLLQGPPISDIRSPYDLALQCLNRTLTPAQKQTTFTVASFVDRSNRANFVSDSGVGTFASQGSEDMIYTSLALAGVTVTDMSQYQRNMMDWQMQKIYQSNASAARNGQRGISATLKFPDVSVSGAITSLDVNMTSGGVGIRVAGIGAGRYKNRILVGMDARLVEMAGGQRPDGHFMEAGKQVATTRIYKQIVGYQNEAGATRFFGNGGSSTLIDIDLGEKKSEAMQHIVRIMVDGLVARLLVNYFGVTACNDHIAYGDQLLVPKAETAPATATTASGSPQSAPAAPGPSAPAPAPATTAAAPAAKTEALATTK